MREINGNNNGIKQKEVKDKISSNLIFYGTVK